MRHAYQLKRHIPKYEAIIRRSLNFVSLLSFNKAHYITCNFQINFPNLLFPSRFWNSMQGIHNPMFTRKAHSVRTLKKFYKPPKLPTSHAQKNLRCTNSTQELHHVTEKRTRLNVTRKIVSKQQSKSLSFRQHGSLSGIEQQIQAILNAYEKLEILF